MSLLSLARLARQGLDLFKIICLNIIDGFARPDQAILEIMLRESEAFYSGAATAREAAERIQSRAGIYLSEQYG